MASHHHHHHVEMEMMPTSHHAWHYCRPPPSCTSPAPYAFRAFNGACLGPVNPETFSPVESNTFSWQHKGPMADCSQLQPLPAAPAAEATRSHQERARLRRKRSKKNLLYLTGDCKPKMIPSTVPNSPYSTSEDESDCHQPRLTRAELQRTSKFS